MARYLLNASVPEGDERLRRLVRRLAGDKRLLQRRLAHALTENASLAVLLDAAWTAIQELKDDGDESPLDHGEAADDEE